MPMISYAQNREDVLLARVFGDAPAGFYIDVGANHPLCSSVTRHFYDRGWRGINIEPSRIFELLAAGRTRDINLQVALADRPGMTILYEFPGAEGLSTCVWEEADEHRRRLSLEYTPRSVAVRTLADVCAEHVSGPIDFISIDVEGYEPQVIRGGDWQQWRPRIVLVEATRPNRPIATHQGWEHLLLGQAYEFACFDGLNRFYVRAEDRDVIERLRVPVNVFDDYVVYEHMNQLAAAQAEFEYQKSVLNQALSQRQAAIDHLEANLAQLKDLNRFSVSVARRVQDLQRRFPRLVQALKRCRSLRPSRGTKSEEGTGCPESNWKKSA